MKILLSNDDGINAQGLATLKKAAQDFGDSITVAPADQQSGKSHGVTWEGPVRLDKRGPNQFAVHGTPADCVRLGLLRVIPDANWVLSGINQGGNLGADVHYSGTVAAVREAVLHGWPGIAFSQYMRGPDVNWTRSTGWAIRILKDLLKRPIKPGLFYNVNFPHLDPNDPDPEVVFCPLDPSPIPLSYRHEGDDHHVYDGNYAQRGRIPGADVETCFGGNISVTEIRLF